jgi:hypothetical protein
MFQYTKRILGYIRRVNIADYIQTRYASMKLIRTTPLHVLLHTVPKIKFMYS